MSASTNGAGSNYIVMSAGATGPTGTGAHTLVCLVKTPVGTVAAGFASLMAGATRTRDLIVDATHLFGVNDFSSGFGTLSADTWYVAAISKPAGSAHYRCHLWTYANPASGSMSHGEAVGAANQGDGSTTDSVRLGDGDDVGNGLVAVIGVWTTVLSDANLDTLVSNSLVSWAALSPQALFTLNNWNGTTGAKDVVGTSTQSSVTGTVSVGAEPPGFTFDLATPVGTKSTNRHPGKGPGKARFFQTPRATNIAAAGNVVNIDGSLTVTANRTATVAVTHTVAGSLTVTANRTATVAVTHTVAGSLTVTANRTASIARIANIAGSLVITAGRTATIAVTHTVGGSLVITANRTATVAVTHTISGTRVTTVNRTATVAVTHTVAGTRPITVGLSATVAVTHTIGGTRVTTVNRVATVAVTHTISGTRVITVGLLGSVSTVINGSLTETVNRTATITVTHTVAATRPITVGLSADITVVSGGGANSSMFLPFF